MVLFRFHARLIALIAWSLLVTHLIAEHPNGDPVILTWTDTHGVLDEKTLMEMYERMERPKVDVFIFAGDHQRTGAVLPPPAEGYKDMLDVVQRVFRPEYCIVGAGNHDYARQAVAIENDLDNFAKYYISGVGRSKDEGDAFIREALNRVPKSDVDDVRKLFPGGKGIVYNGMKVYAPIHGTVELEGVPAGQNDPENLRVFVTCMSPGRGRSNAFTLPEPNEDHRPAVDYGKLWEPITRDKPHIVVSHAPPAAAHFSEVGVGQALSGVEYEGPDTGLSDPLRYFHWDTETNEPFGLVEVLQPLPVLQGIGEACKEAGSVKAIISGHTHESIRGRFLSGIPHFNPISTMSTGWWPIIDHPEAVLPYLRPPILFDLGKSTQEATSLAEVNFEYDPEKPFDHPFIPWACPLVRPTEKEVSDTAEKFGWPANLRTWESLTPTLRRAIATACHIEKYPWFNPSTEAHWRTREKNVLLFLSEVKSRRMTWISEADSEDQREARRRIVAIWEQQSLKLKFDRLMGLSTEAWLSEETTQYSDPMYRNRMALQDFVGMIEKQNKEWKAKSDASGDERQREMDVEASNIMIARATNLLDEVVGGFRKNHVPKLAVERISVALGDFPPATDGYWSPWASKARGSEVDHATLVHVL